MQEGQSTKCDRMSQVHAGLKTHLGIESTADLVDHVRSVWETTAVRLPNYLELVAGMHYCSVFQLHTRS